MDRLLLLLIFLPMLSAFPIYLLGKRHLTRAFGLTVALGAAQVMLCVLMAMSPTALRVDDPYGLGLGLHLRADGFRTMYAGVACFMWLMTGLMLPQYMQHGHRQGRYLFFTLLTQGATIGVFLSDDLVTAFLFFEILSLSSYCWVIHEETPGAMRAGQTYLAISLLGGMAMLMGLMLLDEQLGTLRFGLMARQAELVGAARLYLPAALILTGFGAKAGLFPLHVWLPKAHPVAPAPASALLSGILTKVGVFGILVVSTRLFPEDTAWGTLLFTLGLINMLLGAILALLSTDLKRTLACSSMSQIGFIMVGVGLQSLLGEHNALAAQGTVLNMLNHSLIKLVLFMAAGTVYMNLHQLNLNDIRGYGRGRPLLLVSFLVGAASISGLPFFSGYASKTLLHESIVEYIVHLEHLHIPAAFFQAAEWIFILSGGITFAYMIKLFVVLFVEKHPTHQEVAYRRAHRTSLMTRMALGGSALVLFLLGLYPEGVLTVLADLSLPFLNAHPPEHAVHYLSPVNVIGGAKSWVAGLLIYFLFVRTTLRQKQHDGEFMYVNPWAGRWDLEERVYRPALRHLVQLGYRLSKPLDVQLDEIELPLLMRMGYFLADKLDLHLDGSLWRGFFRVGGAAADALNEIVDAPAELITLGFQRSRRIQTPPAQRAVRILGKVVALCVDWGAGKLGKLRLRISHMQGRWIAYYQRTRTILSQMPFALTVFVALLVVTLSIVFTR